MPVLLAQGDARWLVTRPFELSTATGMTWTADPVFNISGQHVNIQPGTHSVHAVTVSLGKHSRTIPLTVEFDGLPGDVNLDGSVDVADVNIVINIMLGKDSAQNYAGRADIVADGTIDVSDVNAIINLMLGKR